MNLIIDSGATKANWTLAENATICLQVHTQGLHPLLMPDETLLALVQEARQRGIQEATLVFYYGTGCKVDSSRQRLALILKQAFPAARTVQVETDLLGAARALCQRQPGIACILGTGSNSCAYDGEHITGNRGGHGFILGDEGSGAAMGKQLMADFLNRQIPTALSEELIAVYQLTPAKVIEATYRSPAPSRFLASFAPFLMQHAEQPYVQCLVEDQFAAFFQKYILFYENTRRVPIHFTGSIAWHFRAFVEKIATGLGLSPSVFLPDPMEGLVAFHAA